MPVNTFGDWVRKTLPFCDTGTSGSNPCLPSGCLTKSTGLLIKVSCIRGRCSLSSLSVCLLRQTKLHSSRFKPPAFSVHSHWPGFSGKDLVVLHSGPRVDDCAWLGSFSEDCQVLLHMRRTSSVTQVQENLHLDVKSVDILKTRYTKLWNKFKPMYP